jgi:hypothetical protein
MCKPYRPQKTQAHAGKVVSVVIENFKNMLCRRKSCLKSKDIFDFNS